CTEKANGEERRIAQHRWAPLVRVCNKWNALMMQHERVTRQRPIVQFSTRDQSFRYQIVHNSVRKNLSGELGALLRNAAVKLALRPKKAAVSIAERGRVEFDFRKRIGVHAAFSTGIHLCFSKQRTQSRPGIFPDPWKSSGSTSKMVAC